MEPFGALTAITVVLSTIVPLAITGAVLWFVWTKVLGPMRAQQAEQQQLVATGVQCSARVLGVQETGMKVSQGAQDAYRLKLFVEVTPPGGYAPYNAELMAFVSVMAIPRVQPGCFVTVRVDPANPSRVAMEAAHPLGQGPTAMPGAF